MEIRIWTLADPEVQRAKERYDTYEHQRSESSAATFEVMFDLYQGSMTFQQIGDALGMTKQGVHLRYHRHFEAFMGSRSERIRHIRALDAAEHRELQLQKKFEAALLTPFYLHLKEEAQKRDLDIVPVVDLAGTRIVPTTLPIYRVGSKHIALHRTARVFYPVPDSAQRYARFEFRKSMLSGLHTHALLVDIPGEPRVLVLLRGQYVRNALYKAGTDKYTFYVPVCGYDPKVRDKIKNLRRFIDAWWVLKL